VPLPKYNYGQVTGLTPDLTVVTETVESPYVCCGYASAHMACRTAKAGLSANLKNEGHAIRAAGGRPHNAGSNANELRDGARSALGITLQSLTTASIPDRLAKEFAVVISLDYVDLPSWLKVQGGSFGHSACLFGSQDSMVGYFDPLWSQGARGAWVPWKDLQPCLWGDGAHSTTIVRLVTVADIPVLDTVPRVVDVNPGADLYDPGTTNKRIEASARAGVKSPGKTASPSGTAMYLINWTRPEPDPDLLLAVYGSQVTNVHNDPAYAGGDPTSNDLAVRQKQWDADATSAIGPRPK